VVVGQRVIDSLKQRLSGEDDLSHLIHGSLNTGAVVLGESLEGGVTGNSPGVIELVSIGLDLGEAAEAAPLPVSGNVGAKDTVPGLLESSELITKETVELRTGALEHSQILDGGLDVDTFALVDINLGVAGFAALLDKGVGVRLAINVHAHPTVGNNVNVGSVNMAVLLDEVCTENGTEQLGGSHWLLLSGDINGVLDGVGSNNNAVVGLGVAIDKLRVRTFFLRISPR